MRLTLALLILFVVAACTSSASVRPSPREVLGTYWFGDWVGFGEELVLKSDGTFESTLMGHLGTDDFTFGGTWKLIGDRIEFRDELKSKPVHTFALTQTYKGALVLVPEEYAGRKEVHESFVYKKQARK